MGSIAAFPVRISSVFSSYSSNDHWFQADNKFADQAADISWLPKFSTFAESGLWPGYWTPACEAWFQRWLNVLNQGPPKPRMASHWRDNLKQARGKVRPLMHNLIRLNHDDLEVLMVDDGADAQGQAGQ